MKSNLPELLSKHHLLWQGNTGSGKRSGVSTGFPELDRALPAHGWPDAALVEIVVPYWGLGELRLLLPAMVRLNREKRQIVWIAPPYLPYAPALARAGLDLQYVLVVDTQADNVSWAMERLLSTRASGMILAWPAHLSEVETRRLQLAAETGGGMGIVLHTVQPGWQANAAALRLQVQPAEEGVTIDIVKARGGYRCPRVSVVL